MYDVKKMIEKNFLNDLTNQMPSEAQKVDLNSAYLKIVSFIYKNKLI